MERKIYQNLLRWKNNKSRKPLILQGARQVGKTYIVNYFAGKEFKNYVYCNFEKEENIKEFFNDLDPKTIIKKISIHKRKEIISGETLIIFDEIQASPKAMTSLKYFYEEMSDLHIIALGSLLGVSVNRENFSFPVGKVEFLTMYPLDFEEYLLARKENELLKLIKSCYVENKPLDTLFHERAIEYYKEYLYIGGMPEVVENYIKNSNTELVKITQSEILESYFNDMSKFNKKSEIYKTRIVYKNISTQLSKENKKFQYKYIKSGGRSSEFENSIEWLSLAGIAGQLYRVENILLPLNAYKSLSDFKFYMNDSGLCVNSQDIHYEDIIGDNPLLNNFKGGLTENYVFNQLNVNKLELYYWTSGNEAEVDFITRIGEDIIPIEIKSNDNVRSRSLSLFLNKYSSRYGIRISLKNFGFENNIKSVPLYAVFCIK